MAATPPTGPHTTPAGLSSLQRRLSHELPVEFSGSGSEYFRIWIVNLLLTFLTLGLYYPWAKVRRLRYFHGNTWIGDHALDFHGDPRRMLRGMLLVGLLFLLVNVASMVSVEADMIALALLIAIWPALFRASLQFRLANTSWRGMRFHFTGSMGGAYRALLPVFVPAIALVAFISFGPAGAGSNAEAREVSKAWIWGIGLTFALTPLLVPLLWWLIKKYQHDNYALGRVQTSLRTGVGSFYGVYLKTVGVVAMTAVVGAAAAAALGFSVRDTLGKPSEGAVLMIGAILTATYAVMLFTAGPYFTSRMQNLLWRRTKSTQIRFESELRFRSLALLQFKNWLLVALTLGLYWPFAAIATARLKLESITVHTRSDPDQLVARSRARSNDATGDAAADIAGIDLGL